MNYGKMLRFGRILSGGSVGTLLGIVSFRWNNIESHIFIIILAVAVLIAGVAITYTAKEEIKSEKLKSIKNDSQSKKCPKCGLSLTIDCRKCPKCNSEL